MQKLIFILILIVSSNIHAQIISWDAGGDGISWDDPLNWNTDAIPTNINRVIIGSGTVIVPSSYNALANKIENNGSLTISTTATLSLISGADNQITNTKTITNNGEIQLANTKSTFAAIINSGGNTTFNNNGTITATTNVNYFGIENKNNATFNNNIGGVINIANTSNNGIYNSSGLFNNIGNLNLSFVGNNAIYNISNFDNLGSITINNISGSGLYCLSSSDFDNEGDISITTSIGSYGLYSLGSFSNNLGSSLIIQNTGADGIRIFNGTLENEGAITVNSDIGSKGLNILNSTFNNLVNGIVDIDDTDDEGLNISGGPTDNVGTINIGTAQGIGGYGINNKNVFNNQLGGIITINNTVDDGFYSSSILAKVTNYGTITMNSSIGDYGINNGRVFNNHGTLNISDTTDDGIFNNYDFNNETGSIINLGTCGQDGIYNTGSDTFSNAGVIMINGPISSNGIYNYSSGTFDNTSSGQIDISNTTLDGLYNYLNGDFHNAGTINMNSGIGRHGFYNRQFTTFNQTATGAINIIHATVNAFLNESNAEIHNEGTYTDPNGYGFVNKSPIKPGNSTGTIYITSNIDFTNTLSNYFVELESESVSDVIHITGNLSLGGKLKVDLLGAYMPLATDQITIMTYTGSLSGIFNTIDLPSPSMDCFEVNYDTPGVIKLQKSVNEWTGGSASWFFPSRWDEGRVPLACDDVWIPDPADVVNIASSAVAQSVLNHGTINITTIGDLTLDGSSSKGFSNYGILNNEGDLNILNTVSDGIYQSSGASKIYNEGNIYIDVNIGAYGIRLIDMALFENMSTGILDIDNTGNHGAFVGIGCTFLQQPGALTSIDNP